MARLLEKELGEEELEGFSAWEFIHLFRLPISVMYDKLLISKLSDDNASSSRTDDLPI